MNDRNSIPSCFCQLGFSGKYCETQVDICNYFCKNGGTCTVTNQIPYCHCKSTHEGLRCEHTKNRITNENSILEKPEETNYALPILLSLGVILLIVGAVIVIIYILRSRESFSHERLQENDFNNPMYQDRDAEPFTLDADKVFFIAIIFYY